MQLSDLTVELDSTWVGGPGVGQVPPDELDLQITGLFNNVGTWALTLPAEHRLAVYARDGARIRVTIPGPRCLFSGPATSVEYESTPEDPIGTIIIKGTSDDILLGDRVILPDPSNPDAASQTESHYVVFNVSTEDMMHRLVANNLGTLAHADRRDLRVVEGPNGDVGPISTFRIRFENLGEYLGKMAPAANLGFRLIASDYDDPSAIVFETFVPQDLTGTIRLDAQNNTLSGHKAATAAPGVTHVIVAGQGELTERQFLMASTPQAIADGTAWGRKRIERFVDQRQTDDEDEQQRRADEILAEEGMERFAIQAVPSEHILGFGTDWNMGDEVTVVLNDLEYAATVTGFSLKADAENGLKLGALIGDPVAFDPQARAGAQIRDTAKRVSNLERNAEMMHPLPGDVVDFGVSSGGATTITSTTWANVPGGVTLFSSLAHDALVRVDFGAWLTVINTGGSIASIRVGVSVDGVDPQLVGDGNYGSGVLYGQQPSATLSLSESRTGFATMVLPAGSHSYAMKAMKTGTNGVSLAYGVVKITVLRWV